MRSRVLVALIALTLSLLLPAAVGARSAQSAAKAEHDRIVAYWTPARLAAAKAKDYVRNDAGKLVPYAKPGGGGGGGGGGAVKGASWTGGGEIDKRSGKLFFSTSGGNWQCSASVANSSAAEAQAILLTAGHCVYDGSEGWSFNVIYIPDYDAAPTATCAQTAYGCWTATRLAINSDFYPSGFGPESALSVDYGFALVGPGGKGSADLDGVTGGYDLKTSGVSLNDTQWAFGYPAAGKYKGKDLVYCKGSTIDDPYSDANTWGMACNMTGGSSGGPWLHGTTDPAVYTSSTHLSSVNSYGYQGLTYMFGPRFNSETTDVLNAAVNGYGTNARVCTTGSTAPNC